MESKETIGFPDSKRTPQISKLFFLKFLQLLKQGAILEKGMWLAKHGIGQNIYSLCHTTLDKPGH